MAMNYFVKYDARCRFFSTAALNGDSSSFEIKNSIDSSNHEYHRRLYPTISLRSSRLKWSGTISKNRGFIEGTGIGTRREGGCTWHSERF